MSFSANLYPAIEASCYGVCRLIRRGGRDMVMMHPTDIVSLCGELRIAPRELFRERDWEFMKAVREFCGSSDDRRWLI